jgi:hypothetical protein
MASEAKWQAKFIQWLDETYAEECYVYKTIKANKNGYPDLTIFMRVDSISFTMLIECKAVGNSTTLIQKETHELLNVVRVFPVTVIYTLPLAKKYVQYMRTLMRDSYDNKYGPDAFLI